jgi:crossover junction endodeoxyribonuclease RuvC
MTPPTFTVGIDPGLHGAVVALGSDGIIEWFDTPVLKTGKGDRHDFVPTEMATRLRTLTGNVPYGALRIVLEQAQAMPKQGVTSMFSMGKGYGIWLGILAALQLPYELVRPAEWTRSMLHGATGEGKGRSLAVASRLFPALPLMKPGGRVLSLDGRADAALMAEWVRRQVVSGTRAAVA